MKINFTLYLIAIIVTFSACDKTGGVVNNEGGNNTPTKPILTTSSVSLITDATATSGGNITSDGGASIIARGVCWNTSQYPTTANNITTDGNGMGIFSSSITGLAQDSKYYVRAYATNSVGTTYGNEQSFNTAKGQTVTDLDGNVYHTVSIGTQTWMVENLKTTRYRNGEAILNVTNNTSWAALTTGAYCDYNNAPSNSVTYGKLYNWYAATDSRNIAPTGWHVPTDEEWTNLTDFVTAHLGTSLNVAKALAAKTDWSTYNATGTIGFNLTLNNSTGFSALPGGFRLYLNGEFRNLYSDGRWWSATEVSLGSALYRLMSYNSGNVSQNEYYNSKQFGFSVRCVKDSQ